MVTPLLKVKNVSKSYGSYCAVSDLNIDINKGEFVAIMGPSGCGKTITLRMLAGLEEPTSGAIYHDGLMVSDLPPWKRKTPLVWQSLALFPFLSVIENVGFGLKMKEVGKAERLERSSLWLDRLGLTEFAHRNVTELSGGQRQRVALARALVAEPSILLLDEPLSALDASLSLQMQSELKRLQRQLGITFVYVTHSHSEAFSMADRVVIMNKGKVDQVGTPYDVYSSPTRFTAAFLGGNNIFDVKVAKNEDDHYVLDSQDGKFLVTFSHGKEIVLGEQRTLIVRADRISLTTQPGWSQNEVACVLISEEFIGTVVNVYLETSNKKQIVVQLQSRDLDSLDLSIGLPLYASWHPEDCHLV